MICYTLSDCVLCNNQDKFVLCDLLNVFPNSNPHRLVMDKQQEILQIYLSHDDNAINNWIMLMGLEPSSWELIDVPDIKNAKTKEEKFLMLCSQTTDKLLIVYNHNGWTKNKYHDKRNILYNDISITVIDRMKAIELLSLSEDEVLNRRTEYEKDLQKLTVQIDNRIYNNCIVAEENSSINNAKIK